MADQNRTTSKGSALPKSGPGFGIYEGNADKLEALKPALTAIGNVHPSQLSLPRTLFAAIRNWESYIQDKPLFLNTFTQTGFDAMALADLPGRIGALWYLNKLLGQIIEAVGFSLTLLAESLHLHAKLARAALLLFEDHPALGRAGMAPRAGNGFLNIAEDLNRYGVLFDQNWDEIENRCDVSRSDIVAADHLSAEILIVLFADKTPRTVTLMDLRDRAATHLVRGTHQLRRGAQYIFDENRAELNRYPSLYQRARPRKIAEDTPARWKGLNPRDVDRAIDSVPAPC